MKSLFSIYAAFALCIYGGSSQSCGQTTDPTAAVQFANGQTVAIDDFSEPVGVQPGEVVTVTIQFASNHAGEAIEIGPLDGGLIRHAATAVSENGQATFSFQSAASAGDQRIAVHYGLRTLLVHFWALSTNPEINPPVVTPATPEG